jgi:hypothetical protein
VSRQRYLPWLMLAVWASWLSALQALLGDMVFGPWTPNIGVLLLVACGAQLLERDVYKAVWILTLARSAFGIDAPVAILAGYLLLALCVMAVRSFADAGQGSLRTLLVAAFAWFFEAWLAFVHFVRDAQAAALELEPLALVGRALGTTWPTLIASALLSMALGSALIRLPGLTPLRRRRW